MHIALLVPALERIERGRTIVQPGMHQRMCVWGDVSSARRLFQHLQRVERFAAPTYLGEEIAAERMQLAVVGAGRQLSVEDLQRTIMLAELFVRRREVEIRNPEIRLKYR